MKKSTWKKLFTRSKSKSSTRAAKKGKQTTLSCNVCAGVAVINVDTLCSTHRNNQNRNQADNSPQGAVSTGHSVPSSPPLVSSLKKPAEVNEKAAEPAAAVSHAQEDQKVHESGLERSAPVEIPKPQPLARSSTNDEFMTEEVESHNLSDNSRTDENLEPVNEAEEKSKSIPSPNDLKVSSGTQELTKSSEEIRAPSGTHGLRIRRSGTQVRELESESQGFKVQSQILENQISAGSPEHQASSEVQESPSNQHGLKMPPSTADEREVEVAMLSLEVDSAVDKSFVGTQEEQNVEAKNRKNVLSVADVDLNSIVHGLPTQPRRDSQSSGRQVETTSSSNNEEFMSEEVTIGSGASAEGEDAYYLKSSPQDVSFAKHDTSGSSQQESNVSSNQGLQIVEVDEKEAAPHGSRRLSMDATNISTFSSNKSPGLVKGISNDSSEDLKPGVLQAQRSSKLNISFSEHVSQLGDTKGNHEAISHDSLESSENTTEVTIIETTIITAETTDGPFNLGIPSGAQDLKTSSGTDSEEALLPPPEDDDPTLEGDSGMGSDESSTYGPKETAENTSIQQNTANNARPTPTIIFGTISGPEQENEWSQPLFFGPNALAQGLTLNVSNRDTERENSRGPEGQSPFQGFGIISIMRDLYENDSSASQVQESKVTEVTEEKKKEEETEESGQAPPSLDDEEQEDESFKQMAKKQE